MPLGRFMGWYGPVRDLFEPLVAIVALLAATATVLNEAMLSRRGPVVAVAAEAGAQ